MIHPSPDAPIVLSDRMASVFAMALIQDARIKREERERKQAEAAKAKAVSPVEPDATLQPRRDSRKHRNVKQKVGRSQK